MLETFQKFISNKAKSVPKLFQTCNRSPAITQYSSTSESSKLLLKKTIIMITITVIISVLKQTVSSLNGGLVDTKTNFTLKVT